MIGKIVSHYRIVKKLGEGGMGVVYLAEDTHLGRRVAIKFLANAQEQDYRARFLHEARAVSTLSHPHIAIVHDYGETPDGLPFIVMEYVNGETLSELLHRSALTITRSVEIVESVAEALSAAHARGIIHRDIKPSNVLVNEKGQVKVVDFGLAKQLHDDSHTANPDANTLMATRTSSNVVVGTPLYLSPEQAMGGRVDARSDLFTLGALLYECLTGRPAFSGGTVIEIGAQVIHFNPPPPSSLNNRVPPQLDQITLKALSKKPESRYQSAGEMAAQLRAARADLSDDSEPRTQRLEPSQARHSSAFKSISEILRRPRLSIGFFILGMILVALAARIFFPWFRADTATPFQTVKVTKLTNTGKSRDAAISPDGKYVIYAVAEKGQQSLWLRHVPTASNTQIAPPTEAQYGGLFFSPDSNYIYFVSEKDGVGALFQMTVLGGVSRKLIDNVDSHPSISRDGKQIAFVRLDKGRGLYELIVVTSDGSEERTLVTREQGAFFSLYGSTAWSPDGKSIACASGSFSGGYHMNLTEVHVRDGSETPLVSSDWFQIDDVAWLQDGRGLVVAASDQPVNPFQIWYLSYPDGKVKRITNDFIDYYSLSITADSDTIVTVQSDRFTNLWIAPGDAVSQAKQITSGVGHTYSVAWTPNDRILFSSLASGNLDVWSMKPDGSAKIQLTGSAGSNFHPASTLDGRYVVFSSNRTGPFNIWRMDSDGSNPKQLTTGGADVYPNCSPDGHWVVYQSFGNGIPMIWKVSIDGGTPVQLTKVNSSFPAISPDGKSIVCRYWNRETESLRIAILSFEGDLPLKTLKIPIHEWQRVRWTSDGRAITYIEVSDGIANIWSQSTDGGPARQLTDFKSDQIFSYDWSHDGKQLACERGVETSDVVLISSYK